MSLTDDTHIQAFFVIADASKEHSGRELGMFFRVIDAEAFMATLSSHDWGNQRIEPRAISLRDVHDAHTALLSSAQRAARAKLLGAQPIPQLLR